MKIKIGLISLFLILFMAFGSCKKEGCTDETATNYNSKAKKEDGSCVYPKPLPKHPPTITLNGDENVTILVVETYIDAGATAVDDEGNSVEVIVENNVNTNEVGNYTVIYSAIYVDGTISKTRNVNVIVNQSSYLSTYNVATDCPNSLDLADVSTVISGDNENEFIIDDFLNFLGGECIVEFTGVNLTIPNQEFDLDGIGQLYVDGTGTLNKTATSFTMYFNYDNNTPFVTGSGSCMAIYTKQ